MLDTGLPGGVVMVAKRWRDRLGDRLYHPERVPDEYQHLIPDDRQRVARILEIPVSGDVLEVGCGDGTMTPLIRALPAVKSVTASDLVSDSVDVVAWDIRTTWPRVTSFDVIYCCEVLEHLVTVEARLALQQLAMILRPGGRAVVTVPNMLVANHYTAGCRDRWRWPDHRSAWGAATLSVALRRAGFKDLDWFPLYPPEPYHESIWLIGCCTR